MLSKTVQRIIMGFVLGMAIGNVIALITGYVSTGNTLFFAPELIARTGSQLGAMTAQTLLSGLVGAVAFGGISWHEMERPGMLISALLHFGTIMATYIPIAVYLYWIRPVPADIVIMTGIMAVAFFIIWIIMYAKYKAEVRKLNDLLTTI